MARSAAVERREEREGGGWKEAGRKEEKKGEVMKFVPKRKRGTKDLFRSVCNM